MKNALLVLFIMILTFSCEENFNPYGGFKERYILTCILRGDTTFQTAYLTKTYSVNNYDPYSYVNDVHVKGALIRVWNGDSINVFRDTSVQRAPNSKYTSPNSLYYTKNFKINTEKLVEIEAVLPDGKRLSSSSLPPRPIKLQYLEKSIPAKIGSNIKFTWDAGDRKQSFVSKLSIFYVKHEGGKELFNQIQIPMQYVASGNNSVPIYPQPSNSNSFVADIATVDKTMELISAGDSDKSKYEILSAFLEIIAFDANLSAYFNATSRSSDSYSVKLDETDYSNIDYAYGVFGVFLKENFNIPITGPYIRGFGYKPGPSVIDFPL